MSSYGSVMPAMSSPYSSRVVIALNHHEFDLSSTSRSRMICSRTFSRSEADGPCVCIESMSANTVLLSSSTFAGDDPYDIRIEYSFLGLGLHPPDTFGLYVPPNFSRNDSSR